MSTAPSWIHRVCAALCWATLVGALATPAQAQRWGLVEHQFELDGHDRSYLVYSPFGASLLEGPRPLVIALHGGGGRHRAMITISAARWNRLADEHGFYVVYPNAVSGHWDFGEGRTSNELPVRIDDLAYFERVLDEVAATHPIDQSRMFATGHSRGGIASFYLACELPNRVRAIAPVSMSLPRYFEDDCRDGPPVGLALINGTADPQVPYDGGWITVLGAQRDEILSTDETIARWRARNGCAETPDETQTLDVVNDQTSVEHSLWTSCAHAPVTLYRVENGGHTWPSGWQYLPPVLIGLTSREINAADAAWRFFERFL